MNPLIITAAAAAVVVVAGCHKSNETAGSGNAAQPTAPGPRALAGGSPGLPGRADALDAPSKHAWDLFLLVSAPAVDPKNGRGVADSGKPIGAPGTTTVWETWRLARTEVFLEDGSKPPEWDDLSLPGGPTTGKVPELPKDQVIKKLLIGGPSKSITSPHVLFDPEDGIFSGSGGFGETRMNKVTYNFVRDNNLFSRAGLKARAAQYIQGLIGPIIFPADAMEVKAAWRELTPADIAAGKDKTYYIAKYQGKTYGLATLHIITKDTPNWFWATFHHKDNPAGGVEMKDQAGPPASLAGTVWENYVLGGTQIDFIDATGRPILLSDALVEKGFEQSSCISCHSRAAVDANGSFLRSTPVIGSPDPKWFYDASGKPTTMPVDFLYSIALRAN